MLENMVALSLVFAGGALLHGIFLNGILGTFFAKSSYFIIGWRFWVYGLIFTEPVDWSDLVDYAPITMFGKDFYIKQSSGHEELIFVTGEELLLVLNEHQNIRDGHYRLELVGASIEIPAPTKNASESVGSTISFQLIFFSNNFSLLMFISS